MTEPSFELVRIGKGLDTHRNLDFVSHTANNNLFTICIDAPAECRYFKEPPDRNKVYLIPDILNIIVEIMQDVRRSEEE